MYNAIYIYIYVASVIRKKTEEQTHLSLETNTLN